MKRIFSVIFISLFLITSLAAKTWFVCAGSFSKYDSAKERCELLSSDGYKVFIDETLNSYGDKVFRVLFYDPMMLRDEARNRKTELLFSKAIQDHGFTDLWVCEADLPKENSPDVFEAAPVVIVEPEPIEEEQVEETVVTVEPEPIEIPEIFIEKSVVAEPEVVIPEEPVVLETNDDVPLSEEAPYSVLVRSYREEEKAVSDRDRLKTYEIDAYILKKYDDKAFFKFDLHAGAFETEEEAEELQEELEDLGIEDTEVTDYKDFEDELSDYDEMVSEETVTLNVGAYELPEIIEENVRTNIAQFPINRNFQIVEAAIQDLKNIRETENDIGYFSKEIDVGFDEEYVDSVSMVKYRDDLFDKELTVKIIQSENEIPGIENLYEYKTDYGIKKDFQIRYGVLHSSVVNEYDTDWFLYGYTDDKKIAVIMAAENFTEKEFYNFMECSYSDSSLLIYPQIRRSLYVLPTEQITDRKFLAYTLGQLDETYASDRSYVDWSLPIVGQWRASTCFSQEDYGFDISFFDLDYDYNAARVHGMFMDKHYEGGVSSTNKPVDVMGQDGWFSNHELSFSNSSYIIAINPMNFDGSIDELIETEIELAEALEIW